MSTPAFGGNSNQPPSTSMSRMKKMAFDDESVMKALKENDDQSCSETCIQLISSIYRSIKMFLKICKTGDEQDQNEAKIVIKLWEDYHSIICSLIFYLQHSQSQSNVNPNVLNEHAQINKTISTIIIQVFRSQEDFLDKDTNSICFNFYQSR